MIQTRTKKVKCNKNEEIIMAITMNKTIITVIMTIIKIIMIIIRINITNHTKI